MWKMSCEKFAQDLQDQGDVVLLLTREQRA